MRHYLPNASLSIPVGRDVDLTPAATAPPAHARIQRISSEHSSVRGTCNGDGDFIRFEPNGPNRDVWQPRIIRATWQRTAPSLLEPNVRLELPTSVVTTDGGTARVVVDLAPNGAAAVLVVAGQVQVRETTTGQSRTVSRGDAALVWPGLGVSQPVRVNADRFAAASRPRIRGSIVLRPGESWAGALRLDGTLPVEARLLYEKPAGGNYVLEVAVNGHRVTDPVLNKMSPMRYADGRNYPYREPNTGRWLLVYSHDYAANNGPAGGGYEVKADPGQAYRYVWNVAPMMGGNPVAQVQFTNSSNPPVPIELRLLPTEAGNRYTTVAPQPPPAYPPPTTSPVAYGSSSPQGVPHLAVYTVPTLFDFYYPLVVQLQDGAGQPMYPASNLTVTVTSSNPNLVRVYGTSRTPVTTVTLRPLDRSGTGGMSWDEVYIIAASASVAGTATITATAPVSASRCCRRSPKPIANRWPTSNCSTHGANRPGSTSAPGTGRSNPRTPR